MEVNFAGILTLAKRSEVDLAKSTASVKSHGMRVAYSRGEEQNS